MRPLAVIGLVAALALVASAACPFSGHGGGGGSFPCRTRRPPRCRVDLQAVARAIKGRFDDKYWDDGSWAPIVLRLGWHSAGTYNHYDNTGGSDGGNIRHHPQADWEVNRGLEAARGHLEWVKQRFPCMSYADLYSFAAVVAVEHMGGPAIPWRTGRSDDPDGRCGPSSPNLPDVPQGEEQVRGAFRRMGFSDQEMVALQGAHGVGRAHFERSLYDGHWTHTPTKFSNWYYRELLGHRWTVRDWEGLTQYEDETGELMMLPTDIALIANPSYRRYVEAYAENEGLFFKDFAHAFGKLQELGVRNFS